MDNEEISASTAPKRNPGRRPLSQWSAEDTRREIRRHAVRLFNDHGYVAVSIDDIAKAAGVTRATIYYHYKGKADIFVESVTAVMEFVRGEVEAIVQMDHLSVRERLSLMVRKRSSMEGAPLPAPVDDINETMMMEAMTHLSGEQQGRLAGMMEDLHELTYSLFRTGMERGEIRPGSPTVIGYAFWQLFPTDGYPAHVKGARAEIEEALLQIFFEGAQP